MSDPGRQEVSPSDRDLIKTPDESVNIPPPPRRPLGLWLLVAGLVVVGVAAYIAFRGSTARPVESGPVATAPASVTESARALGGGATPIDLPPLDQTDALVRELVKALSGHASVAAWLMTDGLIRNFVVVVANIADGKSPARHLQSLRPSGPFSTMSRDGQLYIDPRGYQRYDGVAAAVGSIDAAGASQLYAQLKPRIEEAYRELGYPEPSFDRTLERAIVALLATPVPEGAVRVRVEEEGIGYSFADVRLERLTAAQRQLLRMGPKNEAAVQASLRAIALALGVPPGRLPAPKP